MPEIDPVIVVSGIGDDPPDTDLYTPDVIIPPDPMPDLGGEA